MKFAIAGGTGFVGKALVNELSKYDNEIVILTRRARNSNEKVNVRYTQWLTDNAFPVKDLQNTDIFINLAGESINSGRWTEERKNKIMSSRIEAVDAVLDIINQLERKPRALINASAIGIYGTSETKVFTENNEKLGTDFLAETVVKWEQEASKASSLGVRTVFCRFGIILEKAAGALPKMLLPYKLFIGGNIGSGKQWMSWIHLEDVVKGITFVIENEQIYGPVNFTAPQPLPMSDFGKTLAQVLHRPHWLPIPSFALRLLLGEMSTLVVEGQKVLPKKLLEHGYQFQYPELKMALKNIFS
ncbi:TIGR01777 family oxidoreductase [Neobacillus rhizosphaerae]|uniref:TIGR01777 family oxidoreductase n=1 Tax=Neobacillus rhizosphaerae TaxID=2880965 RepID=UPI003D26EFB9